MICRTHSCPTRLCIACPRVCQNKKPIKLCKRRAQATVNLVTVRASELAVQERPVLQRSVMNKTFKTRFAHTNVNRPRLLPSSAMISASSSFGVETGANNLRPIFPKIYIPFYALLREPTHLVDITTVLVTLEIVGEGGDMANGIVASVRGSNAWRCRSRCNGWQGGISVGQ